MNAMYKLDQSNGQGWNCPPFAKRLDWANFLVMTGTVDMESIRAALRGVMERNKVKPTTLSLKVGTNRTLVKDLLEKTGDVSLGTLTKLADALKVPVSDLLIPAEQADPLPSEAAFQVLLAEVLGSSGGIVLPESKLRPVSEHLRLCLELLSKNRAIHDNPGAIRAVAQAANARPPAARLEA